MDKEREAMSDQIDKGLLEDAAKLWLAHDGLWFLEVESLRHGEGD